MGTSLFGLPEGLRGFRMGPSLAAARVSKFRGAAGPEASRV